MMKVASPASALVKALKPILATGLVMLLPLALAACPTHTHVQG